MDYVNLSDDSIGLSENDSLFEHINKAEDQNIPSESDQILPFELSVTEDEDTVKDMYYTRPQMNTPEPVRISTPVQSTPGDSVVVRNTQKKETKKRKYTKSVKEIDNDDNDNYKNNKNNKENISFKKQKTTTTRPTSKKRSGETSVKIEAVVNKTKPTASKTTKLRVKKYGTNTNLKRNIEFSSGDCDGVNTSLGTGMTIDNEKVFHESHDSHQNHENHQHRGDKTISYSRKPSSRMKTCKNINCLMAITREVGSRLLFDRNLCMFFL